jgi:hypothetical protein
MNFSANLIDSASEKLRDDDGNFSIWGEAILENYRKVSNVAFIPPLSWKNRREFILLGIKGWAQLPRHIQKKCHLVLKARDPRRLGNFPSSFNYDLPAYREMYKAIMLNNILPLKKLQQRIAKNFDMVEPTILLANSTVDPIERMWIREANNRGIKTICLQHGLYSKSTPRFVLDDNIVDKYIALDEVQAKIVSRNIPNKKILKLGVRSRHRWTSEKSTINICLVGEDWERYGYLDIKKLIIKIYKGLIKNLGVSNQFKFFYKTHPSEINSYGINEFVMNAPSIELMDVFIGFSSTLLKEMASQKKMAIQILFDRFDVGNFEKYGYCLSLRDDENLPNAVRDILLFGSDIPYISSRSLESLLS